MVDAVGENLIKNKDMKNGQYENCNLVNTEYYQVNLKNSAFVGSNIMHMNMSNCNISQSTFKNINFRISYADLNISGSKFNFVTLGGVQLEIQALERIKILFHLIDVIWKVLQYVTVI